MTVITACAQVLLRLAAFAQDHPGMVQPALKAVIAYTTADLVALQKNLVDARKGAAVPMEEVQRLALAQCAKNHGLPPALVVEMLELCDALSGAVQE